MTLTATPAETGTVTPSEATARMADGTLLRTLHWPPEEHPWGVALVVHGLGEHGGRYATVAQALTDGGLDVHAYDHRGFGGSAGRRAYVERWSQLHDDLEERVTTLRAEHPDRPLVMYGHSMGGLIALGYVLSERPRPLPDLLVLSAPSIEANVPAWKRRLASMLSGVVPRMRMANGLAVDGLSRDPGVRAQMEVDPLCIDTSTVRLGAEAFAEQARVRAALAATERLPVATYVIHGSDDPIVPVRSSEALGTKGNVTRRVHPGLRHECHHEPEHADVLAEVVAWLDARRADLPSRTGAGTPAAGGVAAGV